MTAATDAPGADAGYVRVMPLDELADGKIAITSWSGVQLAVIRAGGEVFAVVNSCTHAGASFAQGRAVNCQLTCPGHGARFDVRTGACLNSPYRALTRHAVRIVDGQIEVGPPLGEP